ncbi:MAG: MBL fold metallo-hydrolase [Promethearchaeota archaeon]
MMEKASLTITWSGTANVRVAWRDQVIFFDPWFSRNEKADPAITNDVDFVDDGSLIFLSHGHFDHLQDVPAILAAKKEARVFCSSEAKNTIKRELEERGLPAGELEGMLERVREISGGDVLSMPECNLEVKVIKSKHVKFDARSVLRALFKWGTWRHAGTLASIAKNYPKGEVLGYDVSFGGEGRLVMFGSMCISYPDILEKHANPDVLIAPVAGRFNAGKMGLELTRMLSPGLVIPVHHDDFYPPISYWCPIKSLAEGVLSLEPRVVFRELNPQEPTEIILGK